jgi:hypothetical protein
MKRIKVFVNNNLDGAGSLLVLKWAIGEKYEFDVEECDIFKFPEQYRNFLDSDTSKYSKTFILNIQTGEPIERGTVILCKTEDGKNTTTSICAKAFSEQLKANINSAKLRLLSTINEFYSDSSEPNNSWKLHAALLAEDNSVSRFCDVFINGYTAVEDVVLKKYKAELGKVYAGMSVYQDNSKHMFIGIVDNIELNHLLFNMVFKLYRPKLFFLVNLNTKDVVVKKDSEFPFDLRKFCGNIIEGRCFRNQAGGKITEKFINFAKEFKPC